MNDSQIHRLTALALTLGLAILYLLMLLTATHRVGTDAGLYYREQIEAGILPEAGIDEAALKALDGRLADYLKGDAAALEDDPPFNDREMTHMRDCYALFSLLRRVRARLIPWAIVLILGGLWILRDPRRLRRCFVIAPLVWLIPLGLFALYAAVDFDRAFALFHHILFRNDLWLLDPRTDLLIRICPATMFMHMGIRIGLYTLAGVGAVTAAALILTRQKGENTWKRTTGPASGHKQITFGGRGTR